MLTDKVEFELRDFHSDRLKAMIRMVVVKMILMMMIMVVVMLIMIAMVKKRIILSLPY